MIPGDLKYTKEHEWVKVEGDEVVIGITDHAQAELGDITFVELPEVNIRIEVQDSIATIESVKAASDIYAPVSGDVAEVNNVLEDAPETINKTPYEGGWICRIKLSDRGELDSLMDAAAYGEMIKG